MLEIKQLTVQIADKLILNNVSFKATQGKVTAVVGASGSGKTTIANCIMRILPLALKVTQGQIIFNQQDLLSLDKERMRLLRGAEISIIFQEPLWAFNPLMTIGQQIDEVLVAHTDMDQTSRKKKIIDTLQRVQLSNASDIFNRYPHQLSGGQRQRAMIAQALVTNPKLMIADEPTSNLDVTVQAKIMDLFREFKKEGLSILLISHDLGLISHLADDVVILEDGCVVESGAVHSVMNKPVHPYTKALMGAFI